MSGIRPRGVAATASMSLLFSLVMSTSAPAGAARCRGIQATIVGTPRGDVLHGTPGADVIVGRGGHDRIRGSGGGDLICGGRGVDVLRGQGGNDSLLGGKGDDALRAGAGDDVLDGSSGDDLLTGGPGRDVAAYAFAAAPIVASLAAGTANGSGADRLWAVEDLLGSSFGDTLTGDAWTNRLTGGPGDDLLSGAEGDDILSGDDGNDTLQGGPGDDDLYGGAGDDGLDGGDGIDRLSGGDGTNSCVAGEQVLGCAGTSTGVRRDVSGTWVLLQVSSVADLQNRQSAILAALGNFEVRGFSIRVPWYAMSGALLDAGKALADQAGKAYSIRFMAGRYTPKAVFDAGSPSYWVDGDRIPTPFYPDGSPNTVFERFFEDEVSWLANYCRSRGIRLLHLPWYGLKWAELNNGIEVRNQPGYSEAAFIQAHRRLVDIALRYSGEDLAVEFPMSGYGPLQRVSGQLTDYIVAQAGQNSPAIYVQANGLGPNGDWGAPNATVEAEMDEAVFSKPVLRGEQMIQPGDYDWTVVYANPIQNGADYVEVYLPSFTGSRASLLASEIANFADIVASRIP